MKAIFFAIFTLLAASSPVLALGTAEGFETDHFVFYLPEEVMEARVGSVGDFVNYAKQLQSIWTEFFATTKTPETLHIVVAVRPASVLAFGSSLPLGRHRMPSANRCERNWKQSHRAMSMTAL